LATLTVRNLQLAPLGAGDLIDRTVRLYRRHFMTLIRTSAPPVLVSALGAVLWSISLRGMALTGSEGRLAFYVLLLLAGAVVWLVGLVSQLIVVGGASRSLVRHLLWGEPVTARQIYRAVRKRFWSLLGATLAVFLFLMMAGVVTGVVFFVAIFLVLLVVAVVGAVGVPWLTLSAVFALYVAAIFVCLYIFFLIAGRVAYVPQALMVEGVGVTAAISRSMRLARGNARRLMGMFLFTTFAGYSALMLLFVPLGWVAYLNGINPFEMDPSRQPAWYAISYQVVVQLSTIVLAPVWMMGLSLLYVDERVRHEGYDVEMMAQQSLGDMPSLPRGLDTPLAPALAEEQVEPPPLDPVSPGSMLGLNDRR
jgi:hypothetical protein